MGRSSGKKKHAKAGKSQAGQSSKPLDNVIKCKPPKEKLVVTLYRADKTLVPLPGQTVKATHKGNTLTKSSAEKTGKADFGFVEAGDYNIVVELVGQAQNKFKPPAAVPTTVAENTTEEVFIEVEPIVRLKVVLFDRKDVTIPDATWTLSGPVDGHDTKTPNGLIDVEIPWDSDSGTFNIVLQDATAKVGKEPPVVPPPPGKPPYPLPVDATQFEAEAVAAPPVTKLDYSFGLSDLDQSNTDDGTWARLANIGFPVDAGDGARNKRSAQAYQRWYLNQKNGSGTAGDIAGDLKQRHDTV